MVAGKPQHFAQPQKGMVRLAPLRAIPEVLREFGVPPAPLLERYGLSERDAFDKPEATVPLALVGSLLKECVKQSGCKWFGLLLGQRGNASMFGVVGFLIKNAPDVLTALKELVANLDLNDRGATAFLQIEETSTILGYEVYGHGIEGSDQLSDYAMAMAFTMLKGLCGPEWSPIEARFRHAPPPNIEAYRKFFRAPMNFNADHTALVFPTYWLRRQVKHADQFLHEHLRGQIEFMRSYSPDEFRDHAYQAVVRLVSTQGCTLDQLAAELSIHPRTLNRRLKAVGTTFRKLNNEARHELAQKLLRDTRTSITSIATHLGFSDGTAFNRAFSSWEGMPPAKWRKLVQEPSY